MSNFPQSSPISIAPVDLGLPSGTRWAPMNVGATKPEECGDYFAWGETEPKKVYDWSSYKWMNKGMSSVFEVNKYTVDDGLSDACWYNGVEQFIGDNKTILEPADDAATALWGSDWRMPTRAEWEELNAECAWTWEAVNGVNGYTVTGSNGQSIFLPAAGLRSESSLEYTSQGLYRSSELYSASTMAVYFCLFGSDNHSAGFHSGRSCGESVRAVATRVAPQ